MIVVDASIVGPIVLLDEAPLPAGLASALAAGPLLAPAHWSIEVANLLLVARRRGRLDTAGWEQSHDVVAALRVETAPAPDLSTCRAIAVLAEQERLTAYDAAYLHLALVRSAAVATLDAALAHAARRRNTEILTFQ